MSCQHHPIHLVLQFFIQHHEFCVKIKDIFRYVINNCIHLVLSENISNLYKLQLVEGKIYDISQLLK